MIERRHVDPTNIAIDPDHRRQTGREVQVRGVVLDTEREQFCYIHVVPVAIWKLFSMVVPG
jgi:hypothetical protein